MCAIYRRVRLLSSLRRQLALTVVAWGLFGVRLFAEEGGGLNPSALFTWQNIITVVVLVYHLGMVREQFMALQARVKKLEDERDEDMKARLAILEGRPR